MTKTKELTQTSDVQPAVPMSDEVVDTAFADIANHPDNHNLVEITQDEYEYDTRTERVAAKLGKFAAKISIAAGSLREKLTPSSINAHATIGALGAIDKVKGAFNKVGDVYMAPLHKMEKDKTLDRKTRAKRLLGRWAYKGATAATAVVGLQFAKMVGSDAHAAISNIWVPGTGAAPDHNVINGNRMTLGYEGGAAPFVGETPYDTSVAGGVDNLVQVLESNHGPVTVDGYSQGADVAREAASQLSPEEQRQLILNLGGDPSGEKGILTLAHDSPQGKLMGLLGFDTSPLKDTGGATVNEIRVTNDIMADATFTIADAETFNTAVANGDMVGALRMLANTGEKAGGYFTTHAGAVDVLPQDQVHYNPANPGNATALTVRTPNGTLTTITPNVSSAEALTARYLGVRMTPEASQAVEAVFNPAVSNEQVVREVADAAQEGIQNTTWLPPEVKAAVNTGIEQVGDMVAPMTNPAPQEAAPVETWQAPEQVWQAPVDVVPQQFQQPLQQVETFVNDTAATITQATGGNEQVATAVNNATTQINGALNNLLGRR